MQNQNKTNKKKKNEQKYVFLFKNIWGFIKFFGRRGGDQKRNFFKKKFLFKAVGF